jgi:hypothetical protein
MIQRNVPNGQNCKDHQGSGGCRFLKQVMVSNNVNTNNAIHHQSKLLDDTDENDEAERYKIFLEEYFHKQYLRMQEIYPPSFKSKVIVKNDTIFKWNFLSMFRNSKVITNKQSPSYSNNSTNKVYKHNRTVFKERKNIGTLSEIILDNLEKLGIIRFDSGVNGWIYCTEE